MDGREDEGLRGRGGGLEEGEGESLKCALD